MKDPGNEAGRDYGWAFQPRSQGLSSSWPLEQERRDPSLISRSRGQENERFWERGWGVGRQWGGGGESLRWNFFLL